MQQLSCCFRWSFIRYRRRARRGGYARRVTTRPPLPSVDERLEKRLRGRVRQDPQPLFVFLQQTPTRRGLSAVVAVGAFGGSAKTPTSTSFFGVHSPGCIREPRSVPRLARGGEPVGLDQELTRAPLRVALRGDRGGRARRAGRFRSRFSRRAALLRSPSESVFTSSSSFSPRETRVSSLESGGEPRGERSRASRILSSRASSSSSLLSLNPNPLRSATSEAPLEFTPKASAAVSVASSTEALESAARATAT